MKSARPPKLLASMFIVLLFVLINHQSIHIDLGESSISMDSIGSGHAALIAPPADLVARKSPAKIDHSLVTTVVSPEGTLFLTPTITPTVVVVDPAFQRFVQHLVDGQKGVIRGVYVQGAFALKVIQQPVGEWGFVSQEKGVATEFQNAAQNGVTGLLAHNYLSGALFYRLNQGDDVQIVFGDGEVKRYEVESINRFQKLTPNSSQSDLVDLSTGKKMSTEEVFNRFYRGTSHLTLQTCLKSGDDWSWGLIFVVAKPLD